MTDGGVRVSVFGKTDLGRARDHNEDAFLVADLTTGVASLLPGVREHELGPRGSLFVVADGMGGAAAGEVASDMAIQHIFQHMTTAWTNDPDGSPQRFALRMREAVEQANAEIYEHARTHSEMRGMGTTVTVAGAMGPNLYLAQIGDSRAYLVRSGTAIQLTRDQSLTQRLVDAGELTEEEAEQSERRNIILQALGPDAQVKVDVSHQPIRRGDTLLICSDGLSGAVRRDEFGALVSGEPDLLALCGALIDLANERGGPDNITVVAARFEGAALPEPQADDAVGYEAYATGPTNGLAADPEDETNELITRDTPDAMAAEFDTIEGRAPGPRAVAAPAGEGRRRADAVEPSDSPPAGAPPRDPA
ncbi:MAG: Stp1/IreP family PP2C-type Ser/Thr phosphatase, partial [Gemmatimonadales bacterium]|nr:Stp1/IreP family PP2C-type Ser/Thr phosphatase [Gemmatimonadales bacterium]